MSWNWDKVVEAVKVVCLIVIAGSLFNISIRFGDIAQRLFDLVRVFANN